MFNCTWTAWVLETYAFDIGFGNGVSVVYVRMKYLKTSQNDVSFPF